MDAFAESVQANIDVIAGRTRRRHPTTSVRIGTVSGLLAGIRIIDVTTVLAGPFASYQLGLMGADVIKVEAPEQGDLARDMGDDAYLKSESMGAAFIAQNSGKRSIALDLKSESGRKVFERLISSADVVLENMRPGVLTDSASRSSECRN